MTPFVYLEPFGPNHVKNMEVKDWRHISKIIRRYEDVETVAVVFATKNWKTEVSYNGGLYVVCYPPTVCDSAIDLKELIEDQNIESDLLKAGVIMGDYVFFDYEDDIQYIDGEVSIDDYEERKFEMAAERLDPLMTKEVAESIIGKKIEVVDLVGDDKVVIHLTGGVKLVYDGKIYGFSLE